MMAGRPTDYREEYNEQVFKLCLLGATDKEIASFFDVDERTVNNWKLDYPEFFQSIKRGKLQADADVAESLYKRANGILFDEVTYEKVNVNIDGIEETDDIKSETYKKKIVTKFIPPDVAAQNIWLKNRRGKVDKEAQRWADKIETGFTNKEGEDVEAVTIFQLPDNGRNSIQGNPTSAGLPNEGT